MHLIFLISGPHILPCLTEVRTMVRSSQYLYELVSHMTPSERRHFSIGARAHTLGEENMYVSLFNLICELLKSGEATSDKEVRQTFELRYGKKRFDLYKGHLYKRLLSSLEAYHKNHQSDYLLRSLLNQAHLLHRKGLAHQALKIIVKAKDLCAKKEKWVTLLDFLELERQVEYALQIPPTDNTKELTVLRTLNRDSEFRQVQSHLWSIFLKHGLPTDERSMALYSDVLGQPVFQYDPRDCSLASNIVRLYCLQFIAGMEGRIRDSFAAGEELVLLMNNNPTYMEDKGELYVRCLMNWQYTHVRLNRQAEFDLSTKWCLEKLASYPFAPSFIISIRVSLFVNRYDLLFKSGRIEQLNPIIDQLKLYYSSLSGRPSPATQMIYRWQMAIDALVRENYSEILDWTSDIISNPGPYRQDIQAFSRILNLIAHYELDHVQLLKSYTLNTYRYLKRKERLLPVESFLISVIRSSLSLDPGAEKNFWNQTKIKLNKLKQSEESHEALLLMYFEHWLNRIV